MLLRLSIPKRKRFFIGAEGESERSLAKWLLQLCDEAGLHVHLDIRVGSGGDSLAVVIYSVKQYKKRTRDHGKFSAGLVLLDDDRIENDRLNGRDPLTGLDGEDLSLVRLVPNLEGFLLRLHRGYENQFVSAQTAGRSLLRLWPEYDKPPTADMLSSRFTLEDLQRVAQQDEEIRQAMEVLGLTY